MDTPSAEPPVRIVYVERDLRKSITLESFIELLEKYLAVDFVGTKQITQRMNRGRVGSFVSWMKERRYKVVDVNAFDAWALHLSKLDHHNTADCLWKAVRRYMKWLERRDYLDKNPMDLVRRPMRPKGTEVEPQRMTDENYSKVRKHTNGHWCDWLVVLSWWTGMAMIDCVTLTWGEVDMEKCMITKRRTKTGVKFHVPFDPLGELHQALKVKLDRVGGSPAPDQYVDQQIGQMATAKGEPTAGFACNAMRQFFELAGIPEGQRMHSVRHAFASRMVNAGNDIITVSKITGHRTLKALAGYVHVDDKKLRQAMDNASEAFDLDPGDIGERKDPGKSASKIVWLPGKTYMVKANKGHRYPDGSPIKYVRTHPNAQARVEQVRPCDHNGVDTVDYDVPMDRTHVVWMSSYLG